MIRIKDLALIVYNLSQFYSVKNGIDALKKAGRTVDVFVPEINDADGFSGIFDDTFSVLSEKGYSPRRDLAENERYKVLLEPYPFLNYSDISHDYIIKYRYSLVCAKPDPVFRPETNVTYDAQLVFSPYEARFLSVYSKVEPIGVMKYASPEKRERPVTDKKVLLYLPTYGDICSIDSVVGALSELKDRYYIISKFHHGTSFLCAETERIKLLTEISDETFDHRVSLAELLTVADVVLSDNSGAIFESVYAKVPVAIFTNSLNDRRLGKLDTPQYKLVKKGYFPYAENGSGIAAALERATDRDVAAKQLELREKLFYFPEDPVAGFVEIIEKYLRDDVDRDFKAMHDVLAESFVKNANAASELEIWKKETEELKIQLEEKTRRIEELGLDLENKNRALSYYENGKLYRLAKSLYKTFRRG